MIRKKKRETKDYKIKIFVIVMFFMIIFLVSDDTRVIETR